MKKILFFLVALSAFSFNSNAAIWRVNNGTGIDADFNDVPAAISAANNGDTILVEPGSYSSVTVNKRLVILGNGYFNDANIYGGIHTMNANLQAKMVSTTLGNVSFEVGAEHSVLMGCQTGHVYIYCSDILIKRCYTNNIHLSNYNNTTYTYGNRDSIDIRQCIIGGSLTTYSFDGTNYSITDVNIQNNIFAGYYTNAGLTLGISGYFHNNIFDGYYYGISLFNFQVNNNIIINGSFTPNNCVYFNNIGASTQFGNANNNQQNVSTTSLFTNYAGAGQTETRYTLNPAGPGIGAGFGGIDVGIFGGPDPYKLSGIPPIPAIYQLSAPATTTSSTLPVTISTRSNN